jgi:hypothetical protein
MSVIGVSELWKIFEWLHGTVKGNRDEYRKRAEAWLDAVYADIKDLSDIWLKLSTGRHLSSKQTKHASDVLAETSALRIAQSVTYTKLGQFYLLAARYFLITIIHSEMNFSTALDRCWSIEMRHEEFLIVSLGVEMSVKTT